MDIILDENGYTYINTEGDFRRTVTFKEFVSQLIHSCLYTNPGELVSHPSFGIGIYNYIGIKNTREEISKVRKILEWKLNALIPGLNILVKAAPLDLTTVLFSFFVSNGVDYESVLKYKYTITTTSCTLQRIIEEGYTLEKNEDFMSGKNIYKYRRR